MPKGEVTSPFVRDVKQKMRGPDIEAEKRALSRIGLIPWRKFDQIANKDWREAVTALQLKHGMDYQVYNSETHNLLVVARAVEPHKGERAFDEYANELLWEGYTRYHESPGLVKARVLLSVCKDFDGSYVYGGGHGKPLSRVTVHDGLDCSSSTCKALSMVGLWAQPQATNSSGLMHYEEWGRGDFVTIHANYEHVWIEFTFPELWARFDTSPHGCGSRGPRVRTCRRFDYTFEHRHPRGM